MTCWSSVVVQVDLELLVVLLNMEPKLLSLKKLGGWVELAST